MNEQKKYHTYSSKPKYRIIKTLSSYVQSPQTNKLFPKKNTSRNKIYFSLQSNRKNEVQRLSTQVQHETLIETSDTAQEINKDDNFMKKALWILESKKNKKKTGSADILYFKNTLERQIQKDARKFIEKNRAINPSRSILHKKCCQQAGDDEYYIFERSNTP